MSDPVAEACEELVEQFLVDLFAPVILDPALPPGYRLAGGLWVPESVDV